MYYYCCYVFIPTTLTCLCVVSLINEDRRQAGLTSVGYVNPTLYSRPELYRDITSGNIRCTAGTVCCASGFTSAVGWDPASGLGSITFDRLKRLLMNRSLADEALQDIGTLGPTTRGLQDIGTLGPATGGGSSPDSSSSASPLSTWSIAGIVVGALSALACLAFVVVVIAGLCKTADRGMATQRNPQHEREMTPAVAVPYRSAPERVAKAGRSGDDMSSHTSSDPSPQFGIPIASVVNE